MGLRSAWNRWSASIPPVEDYRFQLCVLIFVNFGQAMTYSVPFTLAVFMVRRYEEEKLAPGAVVDEQTIGRLTGLLAAAFSFAQFCTSLLWGLISNIIGRKPVILIGTAVSLVSLVWFGFSMSYGMAIGARIFGGLFNGVLGAWKCIIGESGDSLVQGKMFSNMSLAWGLGAVFGPLIGGALAQPCSNFAHMPLCEPGELFFQRPFLLPCLVGGLLIVLAGIAALFLLKETLPSNVRDRQLGAAQRLGWKLLGKGNRCGYAPLGEQRKEGRHRGQKDEWGEPLGWQDDEADCETALLMCSQEAGPTDHSPGQRLHAGRRRSHMLARSLQADTPQQLGQPQSWGGGGAGQRSGFAGPPAQQGQGQQQQRQQGQQQQQLQLQQGGYGGDGELHLLERSLVDSSRGGCVRPAPTVGESPAEHHAAAPGGGDDAVPRTISTMDSCSSLHTTQQQQQQQQQVGATAEAAAVVHGSVAAHRPYSGLGCGCSSTTTTSSSSTSSPGSPASVGTLGQAGAFSGRGMWGGGWGKKGEGGIEMLKVSGSGGTGGGHGGRHDGGHWQGTTLAAAAAAAPAAAAPEQGGGRKQAKSASAIALASGGKQAAVGEAEGWVHVDLEEGCGGGQEESRGGSWEGHEDRAPLVALGGHREEDNMRQGASKEEADQEEPVVWYRNPQILLTVGGYSMTALLYCAMDELLPIYSSSPVAQGGLDMEEKDLATLLTTYGVMLMAYSAWGYPALQRALGTLFVARLGLVAAMVTCAMLPLAHTVLSEGMLLSYAVLYVGMGVKAFAQSSSFTGSIVMVNAAPHASQLGTVNGIGQTMAALVRGLGPALGGVLWAASLSFKHDGQQAFPFILVALVAVVAQTLFAFVNLPGLK